MVAVMAERKWTSWLGMTTNIGTILQWIWPIISGLVASALAVAGWIYGDPAMTTLILVGVVAFTTVLWAALGLYLLAFAYRQRGQTQIAADRAADVPDTVEVTNEQLGQVALEIADQRAHAMFWEFIYLRDCRLAGNTHEVLEWLFTQPVVPSQAAFNSAWQHLSHGERQAIRAILADHELIATGSMALTDKGREYVSWRNPAQNQGQDPTV